MHSPCTRRSTDHCAALPGPASSSFEGEILAIDADVAAQVWGDRTLDVQRQATSSAWGEPASSGWKAVSLIGRIPMAATRAMVVA